MITVLTGDMVSAGDSLIVDRGLKLLQIFNPGGKVLKLDRWKPIDDRLEEINQGKALILLGGPAIVEDIYPGIYPLTNDLSRIKVPIIALGLGVDIRPFTTRRLRDFRFKNSSKPLIDRLLGDFKWIGIRDYITQKVLLNNDINTGKVIGCPAWFNVDNLGQPIMNRKIETVAFAPGVSHLYGISDRESSFKQQNQVMAFMARNFSDKKKYCIFQDSLENDDLASTELRNIQQRLAKDASDFGFETVNCTYNVGRMIDTYKKTDLLISYRVHSHICMLSLGKPSLLVSEDNRGYGMNEFIGLRNFVPFCYDGLGVDDPTCEFAARYRPSARIIQVISSGFRGGSNLKFNPNLISELDEFLCQEFDNGFARYAGIHEVILRYFRKMEEFIKAIPS